METRFRNEEEEEDEAEEKEKEAFPTKEGCWAGGGWPGHVHEG